jgi:hypothetical protein
VDSSWFKTRYKLSKELMDIYIYILLKGARGRKKMSLVVGILRCRGAQAIS